MTIDTPIIVWDRKPGGGWVALLGAIPIGRVDAYNPNGAYDAQWWISLPGVDEMPRRSTTIETAKQSLERTALEWINAANLAPATPHEQAIRGYREGTRAT